MPPCISAIRTIVTMPTIKEIARKAGVSPTTVSNVLHGNTARVSPATREKVEAILADANYAPNMGAIILAHSNSRIIGVIMFNEPRGDETIVEDPFSATILGALELEIHRAGYFMMLRTTSDEAEVVRLARTWKLDGLVLFWVPPGTGRIIEDSIDTPVVFIDCYYPDDGRAYHNIGLEDERGGYEMARYLLSMGHRDILFFANVPRYPGGDEVRFGGFRRAFSEKGLDLPGDRFIHLPRDREERLGLYERLLDGSATALAFSADFYAAEAIACFQNLGVEIPDRFSVTGFDDNKFSRLIRPRLTTVHQDIADKGRMALALLLRLMRGEHVPKTDTRLPVRLEIRDSVRKLDAPESEPARGC